MDRVFKLANQIRYRRNRLLSYYLLDFSPKERIRLWRNLIRNEFIKTREKAIQTISYNQVQEFIVINLNYRTDRRSHIDKEFESQSIKFTFFSAINGNKLNVDVMEYISQRTFRNISNGSIGCAVSHMQIWENIAQRKENDIFCIFEDDVLLIDDFKERLNNLIRNLPVDFDLIILGSFNTRGRDILFHVSFQNLFRSYNPRRGMYSYIINTKSARKLINLIKPFDLLYGGIDTIIGKLARQNKIIVYHVCPSFTKVDYDLESDIYNFSLRKTKKIYDQGKC